jgi:ribosomal protein S17
MATAIIGAAIGWGVGGTFAAAAIGFSIGRAYDNYKEQKEMMESLNQSPTYSFGPIRNTKSHEMPIPVIYGQNLVAGNIINQKIHGENDRYMDLQVGISEGPIESITGIKANENSINAEIKLGERSQNAWSNNLHGQTFPYVAYYSTTLDAEALELSSTPTMTAIVGGRKVRVWDGANWVVEYSNNPAWCLLDFLTNKRYGLGIGDSEIDLETFKEAAIYSDELVDGEKRFQLDMVIDAKKSALDIITEMLSTFRGFLFYSDGKLKLKVDRPEAAVQTFEFHDDKEKDNINEGSFSYSKTSRKERLKEVTVQYTEPDENYERISARFTDESFSAGAKQTITLIGVNRFSQAGRMARYFQKKSKYCTTQANWSAGIGDIQAEVGDVVLVSHVVPEWIDKPFRIVQIEEKENEEMQITAIEYNEAVYSDDGVVYQPSTGSKLPNPFEPPASVANLSLLEHANVLDDGSWIPQIKVTFEQPDSMFWKYANIYYSDDNGATWEFHEKTELTQSIIKELPPGTYKVRVQSENNRGVKEDFGLATTGQITVRGKDAPPSNVNWGNCSFQSYIELNWQPITDIDLKAYEVRTDQSFGNDDAALIYRGNGLRAGVNNPTRRQYTFYVKALDRSGNYSNVADEITLVNSAPSAPNFTADDITEFFSAIKIHIPEVSSANGYKVYITPSDGAGNATGETIINQFSAAQDYYYPVNSGDSVLIKIGTYDSLTQLLDDENISAEIEATAANLNDIAQFAADLRPPKIVSALPVLPDPNYPADSSVVYDGKLYINENGSWASKVQEAETAVNALIAGTVEAGAIGTEELASAEAIIQKLGANQLIAYETQIKNAIIDDAKIISVSARKIISEEMIANLMVSRGSITIKGNEKETVESVATTGAMQLDSQVTNEWDAWKMSQDGIKGFDSDGNQHVELSKNGRLKLEGSPGANINDVVAAENNAKNYADAKVADLGDMAYQDVVELAKLGTTVIEGGYINSSLLTADNIVTGTLDASNIVVTNLSADSITAGTLDTNRVGDNTIAAIKLQLDSWYSVEEKPGLILSQRFGEGFTTDANNWKAYLNLNYTTETWGDKIKIICTAQEDTGGNYTGGARDWDALRFVVGSQIIYFKLSDTKETYSYIFSVNQNQNYDISIEIKMRYVEYTPRIYGSTVFGKNRTLNTIR